MHYLNTHFSGLSDQEVTSVVSCKSVQSRTWNKALVGHFCSITPTMAPGCVCAWAWHTAPVGVCPACVCAWEGEMLRVRSTASDCFIFFLNWVLLQGQLLSVTTARRTHTYTALPTGAATEHAQSAATPSSAWANRKWQHNAPRVPTGSRMHTQREWGMNGWLISKVGM